MRQKKTKLGNGSRHIFDWLSSFSPLSIERLTRINRSATSSRHIILTLSYGLIDPSIEALNRTITHLMLLRMRAEKAGDQRRSKKLDAKLHHIHEAIDTITDVTSSYDSNSHNSCKAPSKLTSA